MVLSIIIVNYNVKYFLEQCLHAVLKAGKTLAMEVIVIDNCSDDGSEVYIKNLFPGVNYYLNNSNTGFAKACNEGLSKAGGEYILFLNPDTIVPEDCFVKCIAYFQHYQSAGALGVRMIDGAGRYLRESKRGFPDAATSFFKLTGLSWLFPRSSFFARYYLGHKDEFTNAEVNVLPGAFLFTSKEVLHKTGSFDETFFMYGEDIDLSYRIQRAGFINLYFPEVTIIHFKGESTRKQSLKYIIMFYRAMSIFVKKHYSTTRALLFAIFIQVSIVCRALLTGVFTLASLIYSYARAIFKKKADTTNCKLIMIAGADYANEIKKVLEKAGLSDRVEAWKDPAIQNYGLENFDIKTDFSTKGIVFCESCDLSFASIISFIATSGSDKLKLIHGQGTQSIVGSPAKDANGIVIPLY